ncbi:MAG: uroporphyrinogen decarboxylase family protein [Thermoguttaceae bacterium]
MTIGHLDSKQLVLRALQGEALPRLATGPLAVHYCARLAGYSLHDYTTDSQVLAECVTRYYEEFRPDAVWLSADTWVTAEAMGAAVRFPGEDQPQCGTGEPLIHSAADVDRIPAPDPASQGRYPLMLDALRRIRKAVGNEVFLVACFDQYPFSLACELLGAERAMLCLCDDRPLIEAVMERALEYAAAYARALAGAGADMLSGGDSPAGLIGPRFYREAALPLEKRLIAGLKADVRVPVSLHICGDATAILASMASSGADVLELDCRVPITEAAGCVGPGVAIWGNLDPVAVLARGTADQVRRATCDLLEDVNRCGHRRFVLSSGCTLAVETPRENLRAMFDAARQYA